jgi:hypothetical protein
LVGHAQEGTLLASPSRSRAASTEWEERTDPGTGRTYQYNAARRASRWSAAGDVAADLAKRLSAMVEMPTGAPEDSSSSGSESDDDELDQGPRAAVEAASRNAEAALVMDDWVENSHESGGHFYWSRSRREVSWSAPERGARNVWFPELASLIDAAPAESLAAAMGTWDPEKVVRFAKEWAPAKVAAVMAAWDDGMLCRVFRHASIPIESKVECCRNWPLERIGVLLRFCDVAVVWEIVSLLFEEEALWSAETVAELLEGEGSAAEVQRAGQVLSNFAPDDAAPIAKCWEGSFARRALDGLPEHLASLSTLMASEVQFT